MKELVKEVLTSLSKQKIPVTPENYTKEYLKIKKIKRDETPDFINTELADLIAKLLNPTISNFEHNFESKKLIDRLKEDPILIYDINFINEIKELSEKRIDKDLVSLNSSTTKLTKLSSYASDCLDKTIADTESFSTELDSASTTGDISNIIGNLKSVINGSSKDLKDNQENFTKLEKVIKEMQDKLDKANNEKYLDFLTGIHNRRYFDEHTTIFESTFKRSQRNYAIVILDIDYFKKINDTHGHVAGDTILKTFSALLKKNKRPEDLLARYGGEEFILIINYNKEEEVKSFVERIEIIVNRNKFIVNKTEKIALTFSGGAFFRKATDSAENTIKLADELLYKAKETGRNRVLFK